MLFSVLIPVYNVETYLRECIDSVLNQSEQDFEIVLVDDGSTDGSGTICDEYAARMRDRIRVTHQSNQGLLLTRRHALRLSKGEYVVVLDSDDYLLPDHLACVKSAISTYHSDIVMFDYVYGACDGKDEKTIHLIDSDGDKLYVGREKEVLYTQLLVGAFLSSLGVKAVRRSIIDLDADYTQYAHVANGEDQFQTFPLFNAAERIAYIRKTLYYYRRNEQSMSLRYGIKDYFSFKTVYMRADEYIDKWCVPDNVRNTHNSKKVRSLCSIISTAYATEKHNKRTKQWLEFVGNLRHDAYFLGLFKGQRKIRILPVYRGMYVLIRYHCAALLPMYLDCVSHISSFKKRIMNKRKGK